jgi:hypothetical protein
LTHPAVIESRFGEYNARLRAWGTALAVLAGLLWAFAMFELFTPWHTSGQYSCPSLVLGDQESPFGSGDSSIFPSAAERHDAAVACAGSRRWPKPVGALAVALPLGVVGASLLTTAAVSDRLRRVDAELERAREARV